MTTQNETLESRLQREIIKWLEGRTGDNYCYVGQTDDLTSICLDGFINLKELVGIISTETLKEAVSAIDSLRAHEATVNPKLQHNSTLDQAITAVEGVGKN